MIVALSFYVLDCKAPSILKMSFFITANPVINWLAKRVSVWIAKGLE